MRRNKYRAQKCELDGYKFDSLAERNRYSELKLLECAGKISQLVIHPKYDLTINGRPILTRSDGYPNGRKCTCKWDFRYVQEGRGVVIEDKKGVKTEAYRLRRAVFEAIYFPVTVDEV